ncbi:MAG: response regulator [Campylobacterales bacterium]
MKRRVLVVDDNPNNKLTLELLLEEFEVEILSAENGEEAVKICRETPVDLVFMDLMMPVMDGIEATRRIRDFDAKVMIIAVTALDDEASKERMLRYGAEDYIRKPIDPEIFTRRVKNYLELIAWRSAKGQAENSAAVNLFDARVFYRSSLFRILNRQALAEFWEFFLSDSQKRVENLVECVRVVYALGGWLLKSGHGGFTITSEENEECLYLTLEGVGFVSSAVVRNVLLRNYPGGIFMLEGNKLSFRLRKGASTEEAAQAVKQLSSEEQSVLRMSHVDKISAREYVEQTPVSLMDKIEALEELEDQIDVSIVEFEAHPSTEKLGLIADRLLSYDEVINAMFEFQHLAFAISSLAEFLRRIDQASLDEKKVKKMVSLLSNVLADLASWRKTIFINQDTSDIHYLDSSLLSSCLQIEMIYEEKKLESGEEDDDGIEFFQGALRRGVAPDRHYGGG